FRLSWPAPRARWIALTVVLAGVSLAGGLALGAWEHICDQCPSIAQIYAFEPKEATRVYASDGSLLHEFAVERRTAVEYQQIPQHVVDAFVAVEDKRFWSHHGIDYLRFTRAAIEFAFAGYDAAGGSTITQQLAGNMFASIVNRQDISVRRKFREMRVARSLEQAYTKTEIMEAYLNQINFDGIYGVQNAAQRYFGKDVQELNLPEAATLAAMPVAPARYSPIRNPDRAVARRNLVLGLMADQGMIGPEEEAAARAYPLIVRPNAREDIPAAYFVEWVRRMLIERYGTQIYEAGLRIYTTLDPQLQAVADSAVLAQLEWIERQPGFDAPTYRETRAWPPDSLGGPNMPYIEGMFLAVDPTDGDVLALVGGRDYQDSEFNRATQAERQPGSLFKPFVYTAAIESGMPASEVIFDTPIEFPQPDSSIWSPSNFTNDFRGPVTIRDALAASINVVAVKVGLRVGLETVAQYAHRMGITTRVDRVPSTAIGSPSVIPLEMVEAYTTFANLGIRVTPRAIVRIENADGEVLWEAPVEREEVLDERTSWIMVSMLRDVVDRGSGIRIRSLGVPWEVPVGGKTGTTNDYTNAWFIGFTPEIVTATWVGFDLPTRIRDDAQGGRDAAPVNAEVLKYFYSNRPAPPPWPRPTGLIERKVDRTTGMLATAWCPPEAVYTEVYIPETEPREPCDVHGPFGTREWADSLGIVPDSLAPPVSDDFEF
ncbi:MAG: PBP1A family penicillin-binding protein, partial [Candidatus Palauibacterales bacterium]|nr:PBP1A family penicillin-binding protein [Candidatus Palauibacterales bacterium]